MSAFSQLEMLNVLPVSRSGKWPRKGQGVSVSPSKRLDWWRTAGTSCRPPESDQCARSSGEMFGWSIKPRQRRACCSATCVAVPRRRVTFGRGGRDRVCGCTVLPVAKGGSANSATHEVAVRAQRRYKERGERRRPRMLQWVKGPNTC